MLPLALLLGGPVGWCTDGPAGGPLMRAAQTALRRQGAADAAACGRAPPHREHTSQTESRAALAFGVIFLAGYLPGIWLGRSGTTPLGQQLAAYHKPPRRYERLRQPSGRSLR